MSSDGPSFGGNARIDSSYGYIDWYFEDNVLDESNVSETMYNVGDLDGTPSYLLIADTFGFSVPVGATVNGIVVTIKKSALSSVEPISDDTVKLVKAGSLVGDNKANATGYPATPDTRTDTYGTSSDLWGTTWTPSEVNASGFGVALSVGSAYKFGTIPYIYWMKIEVHYTGGIPDGPAIPVVMAQYRQRWR